MDHVHVTLAGEERRTLADGERLAGAVARVGEGAVLFAVVDDHVHVVLEGRMGEVGRRVANLHQALQRRQGQRCSRAG